MIKTILFDKKQFFSSVFVSVFGLLPEHYPCQIKTDETFDCFLLKGINEKSQKLYVTSVRTLRTRQATKQYVNMHVGGVRQKETNFCVEMKSFCLASKFIKIETIPSDNGKNANAILKQKPASKDNFDVNSSEFS